MELKPQILQHPHIPKPLHNISPRTINGQIWWDKIRQKVYEKYDYHCLACGVAKEDAKKHKWLEAHEFWQINYNTGICKVETIEPLCHYCHNFIHSGRLAMITGKEKSVEEVIEILEHGFKILSENKLDCFLFTLGLGNKLQCNTHNVKPYSLNENLELKWTDYVLLYNNKEYRSKFKSFEDWKFFYKNKYKN